jgi:hypothetical protein
VFQPLISPGISFFLFLNLMELDSDEIDRIWFVWRVDFVWFRIWKMTIQDYTTPIKFGNQKDDFLLCFISSSIKCSSKSDTLFLSLSLI